MADEEKDPQVDKNPLDDEGTDESEHTPEPPIPPVNVDEIIEQAVGVAVESFRPRHPATYKILVNRLGDPSVFVMAVLTQDAAYRALLAKTKQAEDMAEIVKVISGVALAVAEKVLMTL